MLASVHGQLRVFRHVGFVRDDLLHGLRFGLDCMRLNRAIAVGPMHLREQVVEVFCWYAEGTHFDRAAPIELEQQFAAWRQLDGVGFANQPNALRFANRLQYEAGLELSDGSIVKRVGVAARREYLDAMSRAVRCQNIEDAFVESRVRDLGDDQKDARIVPRRGWREAI
jgi:hypothetical protein